MISLFWNEFKSRDIIYQLLYDDWLLNVVHIGVMLELRRRIAVHEKQEKLKERDSGVESDGPKLKKKDSVVEEEQAIREGPL